MTTTKGDQLRDAAIEQLAANHAPWIALILDRIRLMPPGREFTTDDLWTAVTSTVREPRAMGAAIKQAAATGLIEGTGAYRRSTRSECHARPVAVWRRK